MIFRPAFAVLLAAIPVLVQGQVAVWGQCGGNGYNGSKTCVSGAYCKFTNDWYSQCVPGTDPNAPQQPTSVYTPPPVVTPTPTPTSTSVGQQPTSTPVNPGPGTGTPGTCPAIPGSISLTANARLPDPFKKIDGSRVTTKADWECRRKEILELFQRYELGTFPGKPQSVTGTRSGNSLSISVSEAGKSISFSVSISYPSGTGPFPAIIAYGALSLPAQSGVATITFNNDDIAAQQNTGSRGQGKFYTLYGSSHTASALTAWAWGVDRIMDALETTANINIDPKRVAVTGCSRNGKGAIVAGALVDRIALTIPQESGSGGAACWRLSDAQKRNGQNVQTAQQIITENVWFSRAFEQYVNRVNDLPIDHHMLAGLIAPRGLYVPENSDMEWLGAMSTYGCMFVGQKIYEALGVKDNMGYSQIGGHNHCAFPSGQTSELTAFVNKFLRNQSANTAVMRTSRPNNGGFTEATFVDWTTPNLA